MLPDHRGTVKQLLGSLLLVVLHGVRGPGGRLVRVLRELTLRAPLAEQVPALVELLLEVPQPVRVGAAAAAQLVLLLDQPVDAVQDVDVGLAHPPSIHTRGPADKRRHHAAGS